MNLTEVTQPVVMIDKPDLKAALISRRMIPHRASVQSVVIIAVEVVKVNGEYFRCEIWAHTNTPHITERVTSRPCRTKQEYGVTYTEIEDGRWRNLADDGRGRAAYTWDGTNEKDGYC